MVNDLLLLSGNDIPFQKAQLVIHQPTIKEIAYIGEQAFYAGYEFLNFSKDLLGEEDKIHLANKTNFDILMTIMKQKDLAIQRNRIFAFLVLGLIFPSYQIKIDNKGICFIKEDEEPKYINSSNYEEFKEILKAMFALHSKEDKELDYNPQGGMAKALAEKMKRGRAIAAQTKANKEENFSILSRYISILAVGEKKDMNTLLNYTVYQLFDEFKRFELEMAFRHNFEARLAGAKDLKDPEDWMANIH